jgi:PleD family two-component response regulator
MRALREGTPLSLLICVDHVRKFNDQHGHQVETPACSRSLERPIRRRSGVAYFY